MDQTLDVAAAVGQLPAGDYVVRFDWAHCEEGHQKHFQVHLELQENQMEEDHHDLQADHQDYAWRLLAVMPQVGVLGESPHCFDVVELEYIALFLSGLSPASHYILFRVALSLLVVAVVVMRAGGHRDDVRALGRRPRDLEEAGCSL